MYLHISKVYSIHCTMYTHIESCHLQKKICDILMYTLIKTAIVCYFVRLTFPFLTQWCTLLRHLRSIAAMPELPYESWLQNVKGTMADKSTQRNAPQNLNSNLATLLSHKTSLKRTPKMNEDLTRTLILFKHVL